MKKSTHAKIGMCIGCFLIGYFIGLAEDYVEYKRLKKEA